MKYVRNFSIIAHIDHGKSTLADRMLEITGTIERRKMREQVLDSMELERERGITIKMQPVRMRYTLPTGGAEYVLNLIDTPGHIDFYYEVSRSLKAVEGAVLLVDATQGVQAQTLSTLSMARELGLIIVPAVSKVDSPLARVAEVKQEVAAVLGCAVEDVLECSGRTGEGVRDLLDAIVARVPAPSSTFSGDENFRALVFDFQYSNHRGVIVYVRVFDGKAGKGVPLVFRAADEKFSAVETGVFLPHESPKEFLEAGEIGYIVTGVKRPGVASVGDTVTRERSSAPALPGYMTPSPVVWASVYPESQDDFTLLRHALERLRLSDSSLSYEEESSGVLGRGFRCGFLGMLHLEIVTERLRREFSLELIVTMPSITYEVTDTHGKKEVVYSPSKFPDDGLVETVHEPWVSLKVITPSKFLGNVMQILYEHEAETGESDTFRDGRVMVRAEMPLRELMRGFFDRLKNVSSGFASISYDIGALRLADVVRLDVLVADEVVPAFTRVVSRRRAQEEAEKVVERLHGILPRQLFVTKIQGRAMGRILSSRTISALRKDVTGYLYGGDVTRKMKLLEKQKRGKKKMRERGKVNIPQEVFLKMVRVE